MSDKGDLSISSGKKLYACGNKRPGIVTTSVPKCIRKRPRSSTSSTLHVSVGRSDATVLNPSDRSKVISVNRPEANAEHPTAPTRIRRIIDDSLHLSAWREEDLLLSSGVGKLARVKLSASPALEAKRLWAVSRLCRNFEKAVSIHLGSCWANTFEEFLLCHDGVDDPIIPGDERIVSFLHSRLHAKKVSSLAVEKIVGTLIPLVRRMREYINQSCEQVQESDILPTKIVVKKHGSRVKLSLNDTTVEVNAEHYEKLRHLFKLQTSYVQSGCHNDDDNSFESAAFALLCRYTAAQGGTFNTVAGHHAALHGAVFDVLRDGMGVDVECFASPLNCRWHRYCSPFVDTDATFGSLGSFFDFTPSEGSFECNPPFDEEYIFRTVKHITALIKAAERASKALSFVIITPHWPGKTSWENMAGCPHVTHVEIIPLREHGFLEGAQHAKQTQYRIASCDTSVVFLQSKSGRKKYPITQMFLSALRLAFRPHQELNQF